MSLAEQQSMPEKFVVDPYRIEGLAEEDRVYGFFVELDRVVALMREVSQNKEELRQGGVAIFIPDGNNPHKYLQQIGDVVSDEHRTVAQKTGKYSRLVEAKVQVVLDNLNIPGFIASSFNLDKPETERVKAEGMDVPGGAVLFPDSSIAGLSGFGTPQEDECAVIAAKVRNGELSPLEGEELAVQTGNNLYVTISDFLLGQKLEIPTSLRLETLLGHEYGDGHWTSEAFYELLGLKEYEALAILQGWVEGCPVIGEVIARDNKDFRKTASGYIELHIIRGMLNDTLKKQNMHLYRELTATRRRMPDEPPGRYSKEFIPENHTEFVVGNATLPGYIFPRLMREFLINKKGERDPNRLFQALDIFEEVLSRENNKSADKGRNFNSLHFMVELAVELSKHDSHALSNNPFKYIKRLLSLGKFTEDNQHVDYLELLKYLKNNHPELWATYNSITEEERINRGIVPLRPFQGELK